VIRFTAFAAIAVTGLCPVTAMAAERGYTLTSFDKIQVEGPYSVTVVTGGSTSARATGSNEAIERISVSVISRTLVIRGFKSGWGGWPGATTGPIKIRVTTQMLQSASLSGSGSLSVSKMRGPRLSLSLYGSGNLAVGAVESDRLAVTLSGAGSINVAGRSLIANVSTSGSGTVSADVLAVTDLTLTTQSSGIVTIGARRTAKINASGSGSVAIIGDPACSVEQSGSGTVACGRP
jgi:Putative auto-transporter adhesin, head GIN domain